MQIEFEKSIPKNVDLESNANETKDSGSVMESIKSASINSSQIVSNISSNKNSRSNKLIEVPLKESRIWIQMLIGFVTVIKATIGTGVLFAPKAVVDSGYAMSIVLLIIYWLLNVICTFLLFECADEVNDTYSAIASAAMGRTGRILADISLIFTEVAFCAVFVTFVTKAIQNVISGMHNCAPGYIEYGTALITFIQLLIYIPMSCFGRIQSLGPAVILANIALLIGMVTVFSYSSLELASNLKNGTVFSLPYFTNLESIAGFIGTAAFLWVSGPVVLSYYVSIADYNVRKRFSWVYLLAISFVFALTMTFTFVSALGFGKDTFSTVTLNLPITAGAMSGQIFFAISILLSFPLMLFPVKEIFTKYIDNYWKKRNRNKIMEFAIPSEQAKRLSTKKFSSKLNTPIFSQSSSPVKENSSPNSNNSKLGPKVLLRQPSGSISFVVANSRNKYSYYFVKATPSAIMIFISIICCIIGYFLIHSLGNFVNLVGGIFCVPISIIFPALFHLAIFRKKISFPALMLDSIIIASGLITSVVVIWYTMVYWSVSNESICNLKP
ncbi:Transmembrane amino acid transporter protein [Cryptosporidium felis]|nr:Transmembrane amino acid transporter protein [Cryptosporidium felis]